MLAVVMHEFGAPAVLVPDDVADPAPAHNEVLVAVERVSVTFVETQIRAGHPPSPAMLPALPAILGNGVGGVVAAVGPGGDQALIGRRVVSSLHGTGGYAARAAADRAALVDVPDALDTATAVALLADGRTALLLGQNAAIRSGETVLVLAASGGVGSLLVQLAHHAGARVIGAAGSPRKLDYARELGADVVLQYSTPEWPAGVRTEAAGVDVVFDGVGGTIGRAGFELLRSGGRFLPYGMSSGAFAAVSEQEASARGVTIIRGGQPTAEALRELQRMALREAVVGRLRPLIGQTFPLARARDAHAAMERRATVGKTLLVV